MASNSLFSLDQLLAFVGVLSLLWFLLKAALNFGWKVRTYLLSEVWRGVHLASYGPWAVVTGATAGIGKAYAHELARRGLNIVLISRSLEKLKQVAAEIEEQHGRRTKVIQADFTHSSEFYEPIRASLQGLEIGILVNNVGIGFDHPKNFLSVDTNVCDMVHCNMLSTVKMTQILLPQMVARKKGIIINMSSVAGRRPFPMLTVYSATKAFDDFFAQGLDMEYRSQGIIVQSVLPFFVDTNMTSQCSKWYMAAAETFVRKALNTVGIARRTSGCLSHSFQYFFVKEFFPDWLHLSSPGTTFVTFFWKQLMYK
ncbi:very-long-chain 3-oxoacyl-CoA reductase-like [Eublepharis macularius]|uniref:Very-long-chain 3-oxoacyl-CoA reductase-like n=1 Tax=Eublepharis macularius TaxID=481883 RepID=A0AA97KDI0_EUBMA|nr:very-long-chain 3-oxoacyl-CoA reductase-like [Eublepharis macularius]